MITAGIIGGTGYVAGELIRSLLIHPEVNIDFVYSHSNPEKPIGIFHQDLAGISTLHFTDKVNPEVDVVFLCLGHGNSSKFLSENEFSERTVVIDLSNDFRLTGNAQHGNRNFVYGLPEFQSHTIRTAKNIANPGCFATAIQLALLPLAEAGLLQNEVHVNATTGATGAGASLSATTHFAWRQDNLSVYKAFNHQHLGEINQTLSTLAGGEIGEVNFLPQRGNFTRGIFATAYTKADMDEGALVKLYKDFYKNAPFTHVQDQDIHLKQVVNTNHCFVQPRVVGNKVFVTSIIDNLLKGAAGQAIQNMNLVFEWEETTGLHFKANYF
ncbi:MAG: N-acetyl-gamma-glutamyl-phosphate reductase [Saprospiraceae bacterium]|nr:N-acetyl-gamma-glutamyl-phosphate reductase [Saprospiraceae bacterium]